MLSISMKYREHHVRTRPSIQKLIDVAIALLDLGKSSITNTYDGKTLGAIAIPIVNTIPYVRVREFE